LNIEILVIPISSPYLIGIYYKNKLLKELKIEDKISNSFATIYKNLDKKYNITKIYFVNGPGSYMSIKLMYIFFQTIAITKGILIESALGFWFNNNQPIKALGNKYFVQKDNDIILESFKDKIEQKYILPDFLDKTIFSKNLDPVYMLPVVN
jgi:hypothetical protein